jgi:pilus assembly protein CpaF
MFAPPGGRFPPNLPPLFFSTGFDLAIIPNPTTGNAWHMSLPTAFQALLTQGVTDLLVQGPKLAQIDRGSGLEAIAVDFGSELELRAMAIELALENGARVDIAKPISDFSVGNVRCQVVLGGSVSDQTQISFRRHPTVQITLEHLIEAQMLSRSQADLLLEALESQKTILICGPTGSGKTTLLSALIYESRQRVICIEQTPELTLQFPAVGLREREANQEGVGAIDSSELLRHALRMRPDRIALGEVRGKEFGTLLLAINNGHSALATLHASSLEALPRRLGVLGLISGLDHSLLQELLVGAVDLVVQLSDSLPRRVIGIASLRIEAGSLKAVPIDL